jgi:hypothetical protein
MQRGLDPVRDAAKIAQITTFKRAVPSARCASALAEVMRDNEVQSEPVIAKFKEGAVLWRAMATVLQRCYPKVHMLESEVPLQLAKYKALFSEEPIERACYQQLLLAPICLYS